MIKLFCPCLFILLLALSQLPCSFSGTVATTIIAAVLNESIETNVIVAPNLVIEGLWQLYMGATNNTEKEIGAVINPKKYEKSVALEEYKKWLKSYQSPKGVIYKSANKLFISKEVNILVSYRKQLIEIFDSAAETLNFKDSDKSVSKINDWIGSMTSGRITNVVEETTKDYKILVLSAAYFQAKWKYFTDPKKTTQLPFYVQENGTVREIEVPTMSQVGKYNFDYNEVLNADVLQIPYDNTEITMVILLPREKTGIEKVVSNLDLINIEDIRPEHHKVNLEIFLPKFNIVYKLKLIDVLENLGIETLFEDPDLSEMTDYKKSVKVSEFSQGVVFGINEKETEASSIMAKIKGRQIIRRKQVYIDRPFVYLIKDSDKIYFAGLVGNPII